MCVTVAATLNLLCCCTQRDSSCGSEQHFPIVNTQFLICAINNTIQGKRRHVFVFRLWICIPLITRVVLIFTAPLGKIWFITVCGWMRRAKDPICAFPQPAWFLSALSNGDNEDWAATRAETLNLCSWVPGAGRARNRWQRSPAAFLIAFSLSSSPSLRHAGALSPWTTRCPEISLVQHFFQQSKLLLGWRKEKHPS